ncbi:MAG: DNA gyrase inhibitor YacG [Parvularculaceae bacterium]
MSNDPERKRTTTGPTCAVCGEPVAAAYKPFCSKRCADVDLHRGLSEAYRAPTDEWADPEDGER